MMPVSMEPTVKAPTTLPATVPTPPQVGVPPTNTAASTPNRYPSPTVGKKLLLTRIDKTPANPDASPT